MSALDAPPPFRFSRESRIRIDRDGHFWHEGERVEHAGLERGLASWIAIDPETDRYVLRNTLDWCFITVDDAPLVVRTATIRADGTVTLHLSDDRSEPLDLATLRLDTDDVPYCDVRSGSLPARFGRTAAYSLLEHARVDGPTVELVLGARAWPVRRVPVGAGAPHREPARPE